MGMPSCLMNVMLCWGTGIFVHFAALFLACLWPQVNCAVAASLVQTIGLGQCLYIKWVENAAKLVWSNFWSTFFKKYKLANARDSEKIDIFLRYPVSSTVANLNSTCTLKIVLLQILGMAFYSSLAYKEKKGFVLLTRTF